MDNFRENHFSELTFDQRQEFKDQANGFTAIGNRCTATALASILRTVQSYLPAIKAATENAKDALGVLNNVDQAFRIVDAAVVLAGAIASGDVGSLDDKSQKLLAAIQSSALRFLLQLEVILLTMLSRENHLPYGD